MARLHRADLLNDATLQGTPFCRALTERFDRWLRQLYVTATGAPDRVPATPVGIAATPVGIAVAAVGIAVAAIGFTLSAVPVAPVGIPGSR